MKIKMDCEKVDQFCEDLFELIPNTLKELKRKFLSAFEFEDANDEHLESSTAHE